jgi:DNA-binding NarL/FixJ family response regulator
MSENPSRAYVVRTEKEKLAAAAREEFDQTAIAERHQFINARAAMRLLIGAYAVGDVTPERYQQAVAIMQEREGNRFDVAEHLARLQPKCDRLRLLKSPKLANVIEADQKVLIVDDQAHSACWDVFFSSVFAHRVVSATTTEEGLKLANEHAPSLALAFLDLMIPDSPRQGIQLLQQIKEAHLDLPVIMFSGMEDILSIRKCFESGANGYYAKELDTERGHDSIGYYEKFKEVVQQVLPPRAWRTLWQELESLPMPPPATQGRRLFIRVRGYLRRAYYFLTTNLDDPRLRLLFDEDRKDDAYVYSHSVIECGNALEQLVREHQRDVNRELAEQMGFDDLEAARAKFDEMLRVLQKRGVLKPEQVETAKEIRAARNEVAHGDWQGRDTAIRVLRQMIDLTRSYFAALS